MYQPQRIRIIRLTWLGLLLACFAFGQDVNKLIRAGNLYLSWNDSVILALKNADAGCETRESPELREMRQAIESLPKKRASVAVRLKQLEEKECERLALIDLANAYNNEIKFQELIRPAQDDVAQAERYLDIVKNAVEEGALPPAEVLAMEAYLSQTRGRLVTVQGGETLQMLRLHQVLNTPEELMSTRIVPTDLPAFRGQRDVLPMTEAIKLALDTRPDYLFWKVFYEAGEPDSGRKEEKLRTVKITITAEVMGVQTNLQFDSNLVDDSQMRRKLYQQMFDTRRYAFEEGYKRGIFPLSRVLDPLRELAAAMDDEVSASASYGIDSHRWEFVLGHTPNKSALKFNGPPVK